MGKRIDDGCFETVIGSQSKVKITTVRSADIETRQRKTEALRISVNKLRYTLAVVMPYANDYNSKASGHSHAYNLAEETLETTSEESLQSFKEALLEEFKAKATLAMNTMLRDMISRGTAVDLINNLKLDEWEK